MAEEMATIINNGDEEPPEISPPPQATEKSGGLLPLDEAAAETSVETADHVGEESSKAAPPPHDVEESDDVLSVDEAAAETTTGETADHGGEESSTAGLQSHTAEENDGLLAVDEYPSAAESSTSAPADHGGEESSKAAPLPHDNEESDVVLSADKEPIIVETTVETAETPCNGAPSLIVPPPQATEGSNGMLSVDEDPAVAEAAERNHEAEIFAGFSLQSNGIRFRAPRRGKVVQERFNTQLVLEEVQESDNDGKSGMTLRETVQVSPGLTVLRSIYSVMAVFIGGFLFILGFDILLFLFIHLVSVFNENQGIGIADFVASFFSVPVFVYSLAFAMTLVTSFVVDTFYGNPFIRSFGLGVVFTEWMAFIFYLGVPLLTFIATLFMGKPNWWEISLLTWFVSVLTFWCIFSACVFYFEVTQCLKLERDRHEEKDAIGQMGWLEKTRYWLGKAKDATKRTMRIRLSGKETKYKKQKGEETPEYDDKHNSCPVGLFSLLTMKLPCYKQFDEEEQKKKIRTLGEVLGFTSYITRYSWSLDKLFCRTGGNTSSIFVTSGEARVSERQIQSSIACRIIGNLLICLLVIGLFVWLSGTGMNNGLSNTGKVLLVIPYSADGVSDEEKARRRRRWKKKSRMYDMLSIAYAGTQEFDGWKSNTITPVEGYEYTRNPNLPYPTCALRVKESDFVDGDIADYAFIANLAYTNPAEEQASLDSWFGDGVVIVNDTLVKEFREEFSSVDFGLASDSSVSFKLTQLVNTNFVMITIRGTATVLDVMADAQLWISALLFQSVREFLPLGNVFTPILHHLVKVVSMVETKNIAKVAYYQETREFALYLMKKGYDVRVTGHSLGGGLALITGAQAKVSAIGFSAPNAKLSRQTFVGKFEQPLPVSVYDLNTYTFNVVPNRDPFPMIDDKADLYQNINCTASANDIVGCHSIERSICELQYKCGSKSGLTNSYRPVPCECVLEFGYPSPKPKNGTDTDSTFEDKCRAKYPCKWGNATQKENEGC
eukprot:scaffold4969_cov118-Skeletonema_marinoi.AAC.1